MLRSVSGVACLHCSSFLVSFSLDVGGVGLSVNPGSSASFPCYILILFSHLAEVQ